MSYLYDMSFLTAQSKSYEEQLKMEQMFSVIEKMISERVPQIIDDYMKQYKETIDIELRTLLNGAVIDMPGLKNDIIRQITEKF